MKFAVPAVIAAAVLFMTPAILRANRGGESNVSAQACSAAAQACSTAAKTYTTSAQAACPVSATVSEAKAAACSTTASACAAGAQTHPVSATASDAACSEAKAAACSTTASACAAGAQTHPVSATASDATCSEAKAAALTKADFEVSGIAGAGCATKLTAALMEIQGVGDAKACATSNKVQVAYEAESVKEKQLVSAITKAGFKVNAETVELKVSGMECGACSTTVSKTLAAIDGVKEQKVCHVGSNAVVKFDPNKTSREQLVAAIDKTGFSVGK